MYYCFGTLVHYLTYCGRAIVTKSKLSGTVLKCMETLELKRTIVMSIAKPEAEPELSTAITNVTTPTSRSGFFRNPRTLPGYGPAADFACMCVVLMHLSM